MTTTNTAAKTATISPITAEFTRSSVTIEGITYPATYTVEETGEIRILLTVAADPMELYRITVNPCEASYPAALAAAKPRRRSTKSAAKAAAPAAESTATVSPADPAPAKEAAAPAAESAATVSPADPAPAAPAGKPMNPDKLAHGPVPEKTFAGTAITGKGWKIIFDDAAKRTRVYLSGGAPWTDAARQAVEAAGFFWAPSSGAWQKKLTFRAYRAAKELAAQLEKLASE